MAEQNEDTQEKTHEPTPKRLADAKNKGQVARSRELATASLLLFGTGVAIIATPHMLRQMEGVFRTAYDPPVAALFEPALMAPLLVEAMLHGLWSAAPVMVVSAIAAVAGTLAIGGWSVSAEALAFKYERIDPIAGVKRVFSARGLMEMAKALVKFLLVSAVASLVIWLNMDRILALGRASVDGALVASALLLAQGVLAFAAATLLVALVDAPFQLWDHTRKLRMSRQEVKDENKDTEGRPEVKQRIRGLQQEMARRRMMEEVPAADVIVTNPSHFAVALRYRPGQMDAPVLVAKGTDRVAARIRELGAEHGVCTLSSPLLARALYFSTDLGQPIPVELYQAVAQILAWVFGLKAGRATAADAPEHLPIPEGFMFDEHGRRGGAGSGR